MLMDCVSGDVLLKKRQYSSWKIFILATNIAVNGCDRAVDIKFQVFCTGKNPLAVTNKMASKCACYLCCRLLQPFCLLLKNILTGLPVIFTKST